MLLEERLDTVTTSPVAGRAFEIVNARTFGPLAPSAATEPPSGASSPGAAEVDAAGGEPAAGAAGLALAAGGSPPGDGVAPGAAGAGAGARSMVRADTSGFVAGAAVVGG